MDQAYRNDLWAAAYIIQCGCSDDAFEYFRRWLIGQGEAVYTAALRDPESLLSVVTPHVKDAPFLQLDCEPLGWVADQAYERKTGSVMPRPPHPMPELIGEHWDEEDLPAMFPQLWAAFECWRVSVYWRATYHDGRMRRGITVSAWQQALSPWR